MIKYFYGEDRVKISVAIKKELGNDYEVIEQLETTDLATIFKGVSLFSDKRKILIKDCFEIKENFEKLEDFLDTEHQIILWERKLDKRTTAYKNLAKTGKIEFKEFKIEEKSSGKIFEIYETALNDGVKAVKMIEEIENTENPFGLVGLFTTQALKKYQWRYGEKEKRILKALSRLDMDMKSSKIEPWTLVKGFLLRLKSI